MRASELKAEKYAIICIRTISFFTPRIALYAHKVPAKFSQIILMSVLKLLLSRSSHTTQKISKPIHELLRTIFTNLPVQFSSTKFYRSFNGLYTQMEYEIVFLWQAK